MPAVSQSQQRLMGQAYALKKGEIKPEDLDPEYRDQIEDLANGMTIKQLKDYAETSHAKLPKKIREMKEISTFEDFLKENATTATVGSVNGMGSPSFPGSPGGPNASETGSGDIPMQLTKGAPKKKKKSSFVSFKDFIKGSDELRTAF